MSSTPLSDDLGRRAGFPWYYPVVFFLNLALILALELLLLYRTPFPLTEESLVKQEPAYSGAVIQNTTQNSSVAWYLVETEERTLHLIPVQRNQILQDWCRIRTDQIVTIPADTTEMDIQTKIGIGATTVSVGTEVEPWSDEVQEYPVKLRSKYGQYATRSYEKYNFTLYALLALVLSILENVVWNKLKGQQ